jgi:hypothetical protein
MGVMDIKMRGGDSLPVRQFKLQEMVENPSIIMIAKRGSGKSWVTKAIMMHFNKIPCGVVIAPTDRMNSFYNDFFPDTYIHYEYKSELIVKILDRQTQMIDKQRIKKQQGKNLDPRTFIIMDDCLGDKKSWVRDPPILELLFNGRHYQIMYILTMQFALGITPELRSNFDYIFLLKAEFISEQKKLFDHYAGMFPNFDSFRQVFNELVADFGCMVIDNRRKASNPLERLFWYRAPDLAGKTCMMGGPQFRKFHENNYNKDWRKKQNNYDFVAWSNDVKKKKGVIHVEKEEVDDNGNIIDKKKQSTLNFNKNHNNNHNNYNNNYNSYTRSEYNTK